VFVFIAPPKDLSSPFVPSSLSVTLPLQQPSDVSVVKTPSPHNELQKFPTNSSFPVSQSQNSAVTTTFTATPQLNAPSTSGSQECCKITVYTAYQ